jgi:hypothetical protein
MSRTPSMELSRTSYHGAPAVELVIRNACDGGPEFRGLVQSLGYQLDCTIANRRSLICTTPAQVDAARNPLHPYFDARGQWLGRTEG